MKGNVDSAAGGQEVYRHRILELADEYINNLDNPDEIYNNKNNLFDGMIKYIYLYYFKNNKIDYDDVEELDNIWDIYTSLCYKYNRNPIIIEFCGMVNIHRDTLHSWKTGDTRGYKYYTKDGNQIKDLPAWKLNHQGEEYRKKPSTSHSDIVKKWQSECEKVQYRGATEKFSTGSIFVLKADYGYTETAPVPAANTNQRTISASEPIRLDQKDTACSIEDNETP